jgi:hypothetical protein
MNLMFPGQSAAAATYMFFSALPVFQPPATLAVFARLSAKKTV